MKRINNLWEILPRALLVLCALVTTLQSQSVDKCAYDAIQAARLSKILGQNFGYGYQDLLVDLERWGTSPHVAIDSFGVSTDSLTLYALTITDTSSGEESSPINKFGIHIHARTHPLETQGWWVTNEMINLLLTDEPYADLLRRNCVFYIVPMYNPDGVEQGYTRENANGVDIESNWDKVPGEVEVQALRARFTRLMTSETPIDIALNMHSSFLCERYFVYHDAQGTSQAYAALEADFISSVQSYFLTGIKPWNYIVTWVSSTPDYYPESWFWFNYGENVLALTYEDMNCDAAGDYEKTAYAILHGLGDYLGLELTQVSRVSSLPENYMLAQNYPNPFNSVTNINFSLPRSTEVKLLIFDMLGNEIDVLLDGYLNAGYHHFDWHTGNLPSGVYFANLVTGRSSHTIKMALLK